MDDERPERQLNIGIDPEHLAGVYSNFASVNFTDYEFTVLFAQLDYEAEQGPVQGTVVARVHMSHRAMEELAAALDDALTRWRSREGIRQLPETQPPHSE